MPKIKKIWSMTIELEPRRDVVSEMEGPHSGFYIKIGDEVYHSGKPLEMLQPPDYSTGVTHTVRDSNAIKWKLFYPKKNKTVIGLWKIRMHILQMR